MQVGDPGKLGLLSVQIMHKGNVEIMQRSRSELSRRQFIAAAAAQSIAAAIGAEFFSGCSEIKRETGLPGKSSQAGPAVLKRKTDSSIFVGRFENYDSEIFPAALKAGICLVQFPDLKGKTVMIKPNMADYRPNRPSATHPQVIKAAVDLAGFLGAKDIVIADGLGREQDAARLLQSSGLEALVKKLGLKFVNLDLDDVESVANAGGNSSLKDIYLPRTALYADAILSVPKLKTHRIVQMACSMENMCRCMPGKEYRWNKNILYGSGIDNCIVDLNSILNPAIQVVDAIIAMEGDGPLNGTAKRSGFIMVGNDVGATDASCARIMGMDTENIPYLRLAGKVLGNTDANHIKLFGTPIASVTSSFKAAPNFAR